MSETKNETIDRFYRHVIINDCSVNNLQLQQQIRR